MTSDIAHPAGLPHHQASGGGSLMRGRDFWMLSAAAFAGVILSKAGALLPGMSPDDYAFAFHSLSEGAVRHFVAQGRGLNTLLSLAVEALKTSFTEASGFTFFLASAAISLAIAASITLIKFERANRVYHYAAVTFAATHPYLTSYFLFRMSLLNHAFVYATLFATLWLISGTRTLWRQIACVLLLVACSHISQMILILFSISAGSWSLATYCHERSNGVAVRSAANGIISFLLIFISATVLYFISSAIARSLLHVTEISDYSIHMQGNISNTIKIMLKLIYDVLFSNESIMPYWLKFWIFLIVIASIAQCLFRNVVQGFSCLVLLTCGLLATVSTMALSWGGFVPRTFSPIGLCLALTFCLACNGSKPGHARKLSILIIIPVISFCFIGSSLFYQQMALTQWDQRTAVAIYNRITQETTENVPIRIVASWPFHEQSLSYNGPGINESAFFYSWDYPGLFATATGASLSVKAGERSQCKGIPPWPNPRSTRRLDDGSMLVCMVK